MKVFLHAFELVILFSCAYMFAPFLLFPLFHGRIKRRIAGAPRPAPPEKDFLFLVPACNEERHLPILLESIGRQEYPQGLCSTVVVADNCDDGTAGTAAAMGCAVLERRDPSRPGKAEAVKWAVSGLREAGKLDGRIVVIVDADCLLDSRFCAELNACMQARPGCGCFQSYRSVENRGESAVSGLDAAAESLRQWVNLGVRSCLGLGARIHGSGTAFDPDVLRKVLDRPGVNMTEDIYWTSALLEDGVKMAWCPGAHLSYFAAEDQGAFARQRRRWVSGQLEVARKKGLPLLVKGVVRGNARMIDFALGLFLLPRSFLLLSLVGLLVLNALFGAPLLTSKVFLLSVTALFVPYGMTGIFLAESGLGAGVMVGEGLKLVFHVARTTLGALLGMKPKKWGKSR